MKRRLARLQKKVSTAVLGVHAQFRIERGSELPWTHIATLSSASSGRRNHALCRPWFEKRQRGFAAKKVKSGDIPCRGNGQCGVEAERITGTGMRDGLKIGDAGCHWVLDKDLTPLPRPLSHRVKRYLLVYP